MQELFANRCSRAYFEKQIQNRNPLNPVIEDLHQKDYYPGIRGVGNRDLQGSIYHADIPRKLAINGQMLPKEDVHSKKGRNNFLDELLTPDQANLVRWYYDQRLYYTAETIFQTAGIEEGAIFSLTDEQKMWPVQTLPERTGAVENIYVSPYNGNLRLRSTRRFRRFQSSKNMKRTYQSIFGYVVQELEFVENQGFRLSYMDFVGEMNFIRFTTAAVLADRDRIREAVSRIAKSKPINQSDCIRYATIFRNVHTKHIFMDELDKIRADLDTSKKELRDHNLSWMRTNERKPTFSYTYLNKDTIRQTPLEEWLAQCVDAYEDPSYTQMSTGRGKSWNQHVRKAYEEIYHRRGLRVSQNPLLTWQKHVFYPEELKNIYRGVIRT